MVLEMSGRSKIHNTRPKLRLHQSEDCPCLGQTGQDRDKPNPKERMLKMRC